MTYIPPYKATSGTNIGVLNVANRVKGFQQLFRVCYSSLHTYLADFWGLLLFLERIGLAGSRAIVRVRARAGAERACVSIAYTCFLQRAIAFQYARVEKYGLELWTTLLG